VCCVPHMEAPHTDRQFQVGQSASLHFTHVTSADGPFAHCAWQGLLELLELFETTDLSALEHSLGTHAPFLSHASSRCASGYATELPCYLYQIGDWWHKRAPGWKGWVGVGTNGTRRVWERVGAGDDVGCMYSSTLRICMSQGNPGSWPWAGGGCSIGTSIPKGGLVHFHTNRQHAVWSFDEDQAQPFAGDLAAIWAMPAWSSLAR
jgi:hypothetical protein